MPNRSFCTAECVLAAIAGLVLASLTALFHWNRYAGLCGYFNDSTGGEVDGTAHYLCFSHNRSSIGSQMGPLGISRSRPFWIFVCFVYALISLTMLVTLLNRLHKRRKAEREGEGVPLLQSPVAVLENDDSRGLELYRVCWIIFVCAAVVVFLCLLEFTKCVICHRSVLQMTYYMFVGVSFVAQGNSLLCVTLI